MNILGTQVRIRESLDARLTDLWLNAPIMHVPTSLVPKAMVGHAKGWTLAFIFLWIHTRAHVFAHCPLMIGGRSIVALCTVFFHLQGQSRSYSTSLKHELFDFLSLSFRPLLSCDCRLPEVGIDSWSTSTCGRHQLVVDMDLWSTLTRGLHRLAVDGIDL